MKKGFAATAISLAFSLLPLTPAADAAAPSLRIDGIVVASEVQPETRSDRMMVPLRIIGENLGAKVNWADGEVTLAKNNTVIKLKPNNDNAVRNGATVTLDSKPYVKNNRIFVPLRFIAETFGGKVAYENSTVTIDTAPLTIDGTVVRGMQYDVHMTFGNIVRQTQGNAYTEALYRLFIDSKFKPMEEPDHYTWNPNLVEQGMYYRQAQYDFVDAQGISLHRFDLYYLPYGDNNDYNTDRPAELVYDGKEDQWYAFKKSAREAIWQLINTASANGFGTLISDTTP